MSTEIEVPVSPGELIDKITILEIKRERIGDPDKVANVRRELELLEARWQASAWAARGVGDARARLKEVNEALWEIEDDIRLKEAAGEFDARVIELARSVYLQNDRRAAIKKEINVALGSSIVEEKSYADYTRKA